jgi:copper chaperone CopZ
MTTIELRVPTVHCRSCQLNIEESLEDVVGVHAATVDLAARLVAIDYDSHTVDAATIAATIEAAGYPVSEPIGVLKGIGVSEVREPAQPHSDDRRHSDGAMPGGLGGRSVGAATPNGGAGPAAAGARTRTT